jgi:hypothetical protein
MMGIAQRKIVSGVAHYLALGLNRIPGYDGRQSRVINACNPRNVVQHILGVHRRLRQKGRVETQ